MHPRTMVSLIMKGLRDFVEDCFLLNIGQAALKCVVRKSHVRNTKKYLAQGFLRHWNIFFNNQCFNCKGGL
jgi:hypothetical protein